MKIENLNFLEIDESTEQAVVVLERGYKIQVLRFDKESFDCNLYNPQGEILDSVKNEDELGANFFIESSKKLLEHIEFWDDAIEQNYELIQKKDLI